MPLQKARPAPRTTTTRSCAWLARSSTSVFRSRAHCSFAQFSTCGRLRTSVATEPSIVAYMVSSCIQPPCPELRSHQETAWSAKREEPATSLVVEQILPEHRLRRIETPAAQRGDQALIDVHRVGQRSVAALPLDGARRRIDQRVVAPGRELELQPLV